SAVVHAGLLGTAVLRLANGSSPCEGTVQALHEGRWAPVCRESWSPATAHALCKRLHCGDAEEEAAAADAPAVGPSPGSPGALPTARSDCVATVANCSGWQRGPCVLKLATAPHCCRAGLARAACTGESCALEVPNPRA
ncbi:WC11 protein, partial [Nothoprocta ornata]|nr:WC11 protein [Nothoprocta pentlandii]NWY07306.1 WC11 protein [Nothoprocta ornata]